MNGKRGSSRGRAVWMGLLALALTAAQARSVENALTNRELLAKFHRDWVAAGRPAVGTLDPKFGIADAEGVNVHSYAFQANTSSDLILDDGNGYRYFGAPAVPYMAAPVQLPSGARLSTLTLSACSAHAGDLVLALFDNGVGGNGSGGGTMIGGPLPSVEGCASSTFLFTGGDSTYAENFDHPLYLVLFFAGGQTDGSVKFNDVLVGFKRQVSPAPATATFSDVPTSDPAFQYVEALAASGITGGCAGGNYCPDNFVTRRQMAVFLAKALGLHWPF